MRYWFVLIALLLHSLAASSRPTSLDTRPPVLSISRATKNTGSGSDSNSNSASSAKAGTGSGSGASAKAGTASGSGSTAKAGTGSGSGSGASSNSASTAKAGTGSNSSKGSGATSQKSAVTDAASAFASDVATVSSSLNGIGQTTDQKQVQQLAKKAFVAEKDEDQHRAVLNDASDGGAKSANQKIVDNTPIVLSGLQSIMNNPSMANTMKSLQKIETARNANILPSITQLSNSAFQQVGVTQQAQQFKATTGTKMLQQLQAASSSTDN